MCFLIFLQNVSAVPHAAGHQSWSSTVASVVLAAGLASDLRCPEVSSNLALDKNLLDSGDLR